jgi:hypothetical protein
MSDQDLCQPRPLSPERPIARWQEVTANWLSLIALAHLLAGILAMAYLYWCAAQKGLR